MLAQVTWIPEQASTSAYASDGLAIFLLVISVAMGVLVAFLMFYFAIKYRRRSEADRPPPIHGSLGLEVFWSVTPLIIFMIIFVWGATVYINAFRPQDDAIRIYGIGKQWMWKFQHPGGQREINALHVPLGKPVQVYLTSEDVIHSFFVPAFRIHQDVLPRRFTSAYFRATKEGTYHLFCSQYCGNQHAGMIGTVYVMDPVKYQRWLAGWLETRPDGSAAEEGLKILRKYKCLTCHTGTPDARAPVLQGLYGRRVKLRGVAEPIVADEEYITRSIYYPGADIVEGYEDIMPTFEGQISREEIFLLIAYFRGSQPGQIPPRVERSRPPLTTPPINSKR